MMRKMKMKEMKKGPCFKYGKKGDKAHRPETTEKELRVKMMNMETDSNTCRHKSIQAGLGTQDPRKEWMLVRRSVLGVHV
jgi:hypothetical protein